MRDELIAAFLDGSVDPGHRDDVAGCIAEDPRARLILAEAARFLEEEEEAPIVAHAAARSPRSFVPRWAGILAASLALALTLPGRSDRPGGVDWCALFAAPASSWGPAARVDRGEANLFGFAWVDARESRSFRVGVAHLDLEIALRSGDQEARNDALDRLRDLVEVGPRLASALENAVQNPGQESRGELDKALSSAAPDRSHYGVSPTVRTSRALVGAGSAIAFSGM